MMWRKFPVRVLIAVIGVILVAADLFPEQVGHAVRVLPDGSLDYETDAMGNRVPDFSHAGYGGGGVELPIVPAVVRLAPTGEDDMGRIQSAIDYVSSLPVDKRGIRGAVLLEPGEFYVSGSLRIGASGVVLRGSGSGEEGTWVVATGTGRRTLVQVKGVDDRQLEEGQAVILDNHVPVGGKSLTVNDAASLGKGDRILITRPSPQSWIQEVGMETAPARTHYRWKAGTLDLEWDRRIVGVEGNVIHLDAPLTTALEKRFGSSLIRKYEWEGRISNVGIEHLRLVSAFDPGNPIDENHSWMAIELDNIENAWVAGVTGVHFASSLVDIGFGARAVTVMDCASLRPVSENGGYRRHAFHTAGQQTLFVRCFSEYGRCDFTAGYLAAGPNVFLESRTLKSSDMSGSIGSWASGLLFDNVHIDGGSLALDNLEVRYGGVGWAAANSVLWQSSGSQVIVRSPPGALNWGIGVWGEFYGDGRWQNSNEFVEPGSLYRAQLAQRLGPSALEALESIGSEASRKSIPSFEERGLQVPASVEEKVEEPMRIINGWITGPGGLLTGSQSPTSWWRGHLLPSRTDDHHASITRFLPGRHGDGATNDLEALADRMVDRNEISMRHHWGLWYDRRREDHQMIRRASGDVWPPFFEQPFARSGQGTAWDGLSRYDLTKFNPWYFNRLRKFAEIAAKKGRVLVNEMYFQHNIIESGAHWVDFPWRPVNNIQDMPFPEPPPFTGDTVMIGNLFYDIENEGLRESHRRYIRHSLENLSGQSNVIYTTGDEYTGPLPFVEFWLQTIREWVGEGNPDPVVALSAPKDVQDAVLRDKELSRLVDVVEFKYWFDTDEGLFAPDGGLQLSPRQHLRKWDGPSPGPANIASMIRKYRKEYPDKAIIASEIRGLDGWAVLAGGGSLPDLPPTMDSGMRNALPHTKAVDSPHGAKNQWMLGDAEKGNFFIYKIGPGRPLFQAGEAHDVFEARRVDLRTGRLAGDAVVVGGGRLTELPASSGQATAYWLTQR